MKQRILRGITLQEAIEKISILQMIRSHIIISHFGGTNNQTNNIFANSTLYFPCSFV